MELSSAEARPSSFVIFGATSGIGSALARYLASGGAQLTLAARDTAKVTALAEQLGARNCRVEAADFESYETCLTQAIESYGRVDGVVNCIGSVLLKPAHLTTPAEFEEVIRLNLVSAFAAVRAAARALRSGGGSIVLLASAAARLGLANHEAIAAAKGGVVGLTLSAAATYAAQGIRVNAVAPGLVTTPGTERVWANEISRQASLALHPLGRIGTPADVVGAICWLLGPESGWVTGQVIGVDGGLATLKTRARS